MTDFTRQIRDLLGEDNFDVVFIILKTFLATDSAANNDFINDLAMIKGSYTSAQKSFYNNEISREHYTLETAKVRKSITLVLDEIDDTTFDKAQADAIIQKVLEEEYTALPAKSINFGKKYGLYIALMSIIATAAGYFLFFKSKGNDAVSKMEQSVKQKPVEFVKPKVINPSDFNFYYGEAARIRQTVGQDNYTTEDGRMRIRKAKTYLDSAIMARADDAKVYNSRADCYMILGKLDSAMADIDTGLGHDSYLTYLYATRAQIKALKGDVEGFYSDLEEALTRGHNVWRMRNSLGVRDFSTKPRFIKLLKRYNQYE
jgi:tetratricopeptide (TPR) repeat protein